MPLLILYGVIATLGAILAIRRPPQMPRYLPLLAIAFIPQCGRMLGLWIPGTFLVSTVAIGLWCYANRTIAGVPILTVGVMLNMLVMSFYDGAMPIRADILAGTGHPAPVGAFLIGSKDVVVHSATLEVLSDWIVLLSGYITVVISPGDLFVVSGVLWWLISGKPERRQVNDAHAYVHG